MQRIVAVVLILFPGLISAQNWDLAKCLEYAQQNNFQIQKAENNIRTTGANLDQSRAAQLPALNGSASHNYNFGRTIDPFTNQFTNSRVRSNNFSLVSTVNLFSGFQLRYTTKQSSVDAAASVQDADELRRQVYLDVAASYLDVRLQRELVSQAEKRVLLSKTSHDRSVQLVSSGILAESELTELYAQWKSDELAVASSKAQLETSLLLLKNSMNYPLQENLSIDSSDFIISPKTYSLDSCINAAMARHPGLQASTLRKESSSWAYKAAYARYSPRLTLNASLSTLYSSSARQITGYNFSGYQYVGITQNTFDTVLAPNINPEYQTKPFSNQLNDNLNRFIGLTLNVPIINGLQVRKAVERARITMSNAELDYKIKENSIRQEVVQSYAEYRNAGIQHQSALVARESQA
jgi:outer membrane protein